MAIDLPPGLDAATAGIRQGAAELATHQGFAKGQVERLVAEMEQAHK